MHKPENMEQYSHRCSTVTYSRKPLSKGGELVSPRCLPNSAKKSLSAPLTLLGSGAAELYVEITLHYSRADRHAHTLKVAGLCHAFNDATKGKGCIVVYERDVWHGQVRAFRS
jgi:hypothetical protein